MATPSHTATVRRVQNLTTRMRRVTVTGESMRTLDASGAPEIALALTDSTGRPVRRRYTARACRPELLELDIDVVLHGHGPGSAWGESVAVGDEVTFTGPRGRISLAPAPWYLLVADDAGLPAVAALLDEAPTGTRAIAVLEVHDGSECLPLSDDPAHDVRWALRNGRPPGQPDALREALSSVELPAGAGQTWIFAESRVGLALRDALASRGLPRADIHVKGYWNTGRERPVGPAVRAVESGEPIVSVVPITPT